MPILRPVTKQTICVLGTGTMGQGIAQVTAAAGFPTRLYDIAPERASQAVASIGVQLDKLLAKGKITADARAATFERLSAAADLRRACEGAELVI